MSNIVSDNSNNRIKVVQEELKRILSIIMYSIENEPEDGFDSIIANSNNPEDIRIAEELNKSTKKLDKNAQEYVQNIGIPSKPKQVSHKNKETMPTTKVNRINPIINNVKSKDSNITLSKSRDDFDIEH